jgi:energy-coupling factor transporter transmembrane protein EcfT
MGRVRRTFDTPQRALDPQLSDGLVLIIGCCLYIATGVAKLPLVQVIRQIWTFLIVLILILFLITFFPPLITWLPTLLKT